MNGMCGIERCVGSRLSGLVAIVRPTSRALPWAGLACPFGAQIRSATGAAYASPGQRPGITRDHLFPALNGRPNDQFADALDAVVKMRELVLELAVQGRLVEQKPAEGDGHALLRQIHKKNPPSVTETDVEPMDSELASFPSSWAPSKLGEVAEIIRGVTFPGSAKSETPSNGHVRASERPAFRRKLTGTT